MLKRISLIVVLSLSTAFAFSYSSFPPITEKNTLAISPFIFADAKDHGAMETFFFYGLTPKSDLSISMFNGYGTADFSFMPRYKVGSVITAVRANAFWADPQGTFYCENKRAYLQLTGTAHITYDYPDKPAFYGIVAPGLFFKGFDVCCDIITGYYQQDGDCGGLRTKGFGLDIGPCVGFKVGEAFFVLSTPIYNVNKDAMVTVGLGIYYTVK
jgi:hypothetical protein